MQETSDADTPQRIFGRRMRQIRERLGLTQVDLASLLDVRDGIKIDPSAIARIERDDRVVRLNEAVAIARAFDTSVDEMLRGALTPAEQRQQAERQVEQTRLLAAQYAAEHEVAVARLERLSNRQEGE